MGKKLKFQVISIIVLMVGAIGLTIGFSAFSNSLSISGSANVAPNQSTFNVDFSSSSSSVVTSNITRSLSPTTLTATQAVIDNSSSPTISDLSVTFTEPNQTATYSFYALNIGQYDAYLKSILFTNIQNDTVPKKCVAGAGTTASLVAAACDSIVLKVQVGEESSAVSSSVLSMSNHKLEKDDYEPIIVTIEYAEGGSVADGDFSVAFGDITLNYSSVD